MLPWTVSRRLVPYNARTLETMSLAPGTRIGCYEVVSIVGAGGMGEVYRARDTRLRRDVAVKILPARFADDAERLARFEREAQVLASLTHPHIAAIHGFEDHDDIHALVLEFVEGETLADRIARGPVPLDEALPVARQIAEALEAAHEHGIVHRDLKPANIKITPDGAVKVLDFGLAKLADASSASAMPTPLSLSPTITSPALMTQAGMLLGTAAYMAPEQAKGKPADKRSDIWAFGTVLYEMLTGRRAFGGDDVTDTLAAVMKDVPKYDALSPRTPRRLRHLLERCLERDVKMRLRDIGEARIELAAIAAGQLDEAAPPAASRHALWLGAGVLVGTALTTAALLMWGRPPSATVGPRARFQVTLPENVQLAEASGGISVSPDGRLVVFTANGGKGRSLWLRPIDGDDTKALPGTENATLPFWSPDSASVGFFAADKMKRLTISTGTIQVICGDISQAPGGGAWNQDDIIIFSPQLEGALFQVPATGGTPKPLTSLDEASHESNHMWPAFLPDGRHYLYQASAGIYIGTLGSTDRTLLIRQESLDLTAVQYSPSGHLVYVRNHQLVARPFDLETRTLTGDEFPLADGFGIGGPGRPPFGVSQTGVLVYRRRGEPATYRVTWFGRDGTRQGTIGSPGPYAALNLSPDGQTLALTRFTEKETSIWLLDVARGTSTRFTSDPYSVVPIWSPQGDRVVFSSVRDSPPNPFIRTLAGAETRVAKLPYQVRITSWAADGRTLVGQLLEPRTRWDLWLFSASGETPPTPLIKTQFGEEDGQISPDNRWIAFTSNETGVAEIYVTTFPKPGRPVRVSTDSGIRARWRDDGTELFFQSKGKVMAASITAAAGAAGDAGPTVGIPRELFALPEGINDWIPTRGGQRFLLNMEETKALPAPIEVVLNWSQPAQTQ